MTKAKEPIQPLKRHPDIRITPYLVWDQQGELHIYEKSEFIGERGARSKDSKSQLATSQSTADSS